MLTISGRNSADNAAVFNGGAFVAAWPRAAGNRAAITVVNTTGRKVASAVVGDCVAAITDVSIATVNSRGTLITTPSLVAAVGTNAEGKNVLAIGGGVYTSLKTSHALLKVAVLDETHIVVVDAGDVAHLVAVGTDAATGAHTLTALSTLAIDAVVSWTVAPIKNSASAAIIAIVRNSHISALRLSDDGNTLKKCGSATLIPTPQQLFVAAGNNADADEALLWVASGREVCAAAIGLSETNNITFREVGRAAVPNSTNNRIVVGLSGVTNTKGNIKAQLMLAADASTSAAVEHICREDDDEDNDAASSIDIAASVDAYTYTYNGAALSADATSATTGARLTTVDGSAYLCATTLNGCPFAIVSVLRQRSIALVPLTAKKLRSSSASFAASSAPSHTHTDFLRRMERARAEMHAITSSSAKVPTTLEESRRLIAAILRVQDEGRALQRQVEGVVADSAPLALLQQLYISYTRATLRDVFLETGASTDEPIDVTGLQQQYTMGLASLQPIVAERLCGDGATRSSGTDADGEGGMGGDDDNVMTSSSALLPGGTDHHADLRRWAPLKPLYTQLLEAIGVADAAAVAPSIGAGNLIISQCGEQLTANVAVATFYVLLALGVPIEALTTIATTLLHTAGLSSALLHWALLFYLADHQPDTDITAVYPHLAALDVNSYDFAAVAMPRVIDALICAGNVEAVYFLLPTAISVAACSTINTCTSEGAIPEALAVRALFAALAKGNVSLIGTLLSLSNKTSSCTWRPIAVHVAAVACVRMRQVFLLEGVVAASSNNDAAAYGEEAIVEHAMLSCVGGPTAHRVFVEFLVMQRHYARALCMCQSMPTGSDAEHQAVAALAASLRCLVVLPKAATATGAAAISTSASSSAAAGGLVLDTTAVSATANAVNMTVVDAFAVPTAYVDGVAAAVAHANFARK